MSAQFAQVAKKSDTPWGVSPPPIGSTTARTEGQFVGIREVMA
jgi:hypothetical protein